MTESKSSSKASKPATKSKASKTDAVASDVQVYIDTLIANQKVVSAALKGAGERSVRLSESAAKRVADKQLSSLELAKKLAADPKDYKGNMEVMLESLAQSQADAFEVFKALVTEQSDFVGELNSTAKELFEGARDTSQAALKLARVWGVDSPVTGLFEQSMNVAKEATEKFTKAVA